MCLPFCEQDVKSQFVIIWLIPNVGKYPHRVIILVVYSKFLWALIFTNCKTVAFQRRCRRAPSRCTQRSLYLSIRKSQGLVTKWKWRYLLCNMFNKQNLRDLCGWNHSHKHAHWPRPSRSLKIPLFTTQVETLAANEHVNVHYLISPFLN